MSSKKLFEQAFNLLCNERIGQGMSRTVYDSLLLPDCVIKVEDSAQRFQNIIEWETWKSAKWNDAHTWLAECRWISGDGSILIMEKTRPAGPHEVPAKVPAFLTDFKRTNFGMVKTTFTKGPKKGQRGPDRFVCHDYGTNLALDIGTTVTSMKKPTFGGDS